MEIFWFNPPVDLSEEGKWLLGVTSFDATNSVFNITDENNSFSVSTPGHWSFRVDTETINKLQNLLELRSQNNFKLHVKENKTRGNQIKIRRIDDDFSDLDTQKYEIIEELNIAEYNGLEHMVFRIELT